MTVMANIVKMAKGYFLVCAITFPHGTSQLPLLDHERGGLGRHKRRMSPFPPRSPGLLGLGGCHSRKVRLEHVFNIDT